MNTKEKNKKNNKKKSPVKKPEIFSGLYKKAENTILNNGILSVISGAVIGLMLVFLLVSVDIVSDLLPEKTDKATDFSNAAFKNSEEFIEVIEKGEEEIAVETLNELRGQNDLSSVLKDWATNTSENTLMRSENIINILLVGLDEQLANSDVMMLASLDKVNKKIYLHSIFRDSYTYINTVYGDKYAKINACYANGGAEKLIETVENNFKIDIDHFVSVNFDSFSSIVNIFGGIALNVKEYEAKEIEKEIGRSCPYGSSVVLDGEQALTFCRIRKCDADADVSRTRRQRQFINALIDATGNISISQIAPLLETVIKYVNTDCSFGDLISLGTKAISDKWYNFEIISDAVPKEAHRLDYRGSSWVWIVDYPLSAVDLHNTLYGKTNISLSEDRISAITLMSSSADTGNAAP